MDRKVVLVTGSSRGIGKAAIIEFAKKGYNVVINYINSEKEAKLKFIDNDFEYNNEQDAYKLKELVEKEYSIDALIVEFDVSNEFEVKEAIDKIINYYGRIDTVVNCAGIVFDRDMYTATIDEFKNTIGVNVIGAFVVARECSKYMLPGSTIVNVSSTNGTKTISPESIDYNISKVGLQSLTRDLAYQFKPNIRVNAVAIGWADTDMNKDLPEDYISDETAKIYLNRFAKPEEIAKTIYFLSSEDSSYVNSEILVIDGGY